jgi:hypothetical protein
VSVSFPTIMHFVALFVCNPRVRKLLVGGVHSGRNPAWFISVDWTRRLLGRDRQPAHHQARLCEVPVKAFGGKPWVPPGGPFVGGERS